MKLASLVLILFVSSCSSQWHLNKAIKKGAVLKEIHDTTNIYNHYYHTDSVFNKELLVEYVPKTIREQRIEYRFEHKRFRDSLRASQVRFKDSLRHYRVIYSDSLKNALKTSRIENRTERKKDNRLNRFMWWLMVFFILILICYIALRIVASKLLK